MKCKKCGKEISFEYLNSDTLKKHKMCFSCNFWREQKIADKKRGAHNWAMIDGTHYVLHPKTNTYFKGFGGRKFNIVFDDGVEVECENLWCQGEPGPIWEKEFPNNARFKN